MYPLVVLAAAFAAIFLISALQPPRAAKILAGGLWAAYAVYEYHIANGTLCDADCNIRVDLVFFLPVLASSAYLAFQPAPRPGAVALLYVICLALTAWLAIVFGYPVLGAIAGVAAVGAAVYALKSKDPRPTA